MRKLTKKYYSIECSDWSFFVSATDEQDAACKALSKMMKARGGRLHLSYSMLVTQTKPKKQEEIILYVPDILHQIGEVDLAKTLDDLAQNSQ